MKRTKKCKTGLTAGHWIMAGLVAGSILFYLAAFTLSATGQVFEPCVFPKCSKQVITCQWPNRCHAQADSLQ